MINMATFRKNTNIIASFLSAVIVVTNVLFPASIYAETRSVTYMGNYEITEEEGAGRKETVRVAGTMGKIVKSRENGSQWQYNYYTTDIQGSTRQELTDTAIKEKKIPKPISYY